MRLFAKAGADVHVASQERQGRHDAEYIPVLRAYVFGHVPSFVH